ncbi:MAG: D-alanine-D-alanine ligase [Candidatus Krumholzibacteriia bacterium]|jgi:D-alanine-D-alanine ligase
MRIAVLMGGDSPERDISLASGQAVASALENSGHTVLAFDIPNVAAVLTMPELRKVDLIFPALHGGEGEDGHLQAVLDVLGLKYALSDARASAIAMDKSSSKRIMRAADIPTPQWLQVTFNPANAQTELLSGEHDENHRLGEITTERVFQRATEEIGYPMVIKLNGAGSSVGVEIVERPDEFEAAFEQVKSQGLGGCVDLLIEKFIPGRELTATVLLGRRLPLLEIRPRDGFYDYKNKYTEGASEYLVPAPVHSPIYENICSDALRVYELIGCSGVARVDFRLDGDDYSCLEINTIPGMTTTSLVPKAAAAVGISFEHLIEDLCRAAL